MTPLTTDLDGFAKLNGVSRWVVRKWLREGMPFMPEGKRSKRIVVSEAEKWFRSRQVRLR